MSREIKFRAWDKHTGGHMVLGSTKRYPVINTELCLAERAASEQYILMQYTGLKDKNGVEIYESDILNICFTSNSGEFIHDGIYVAGTHKLKGTVFRFKELLWSSYGYNQYPITTELNSSNELGTNYSGNREFLYVSDRYTTKVDADREFPFNNEKELSFHSRYFEVIGNIYQNSELLENNDDK